MEKKFKYPVNYKVSSQQEVDELKEVLLKLGYNWAAYDTNDWKQFPVLTTYYTGSSFGLGFISSEVHSYKASYSCNSKVLFLALAAQTSNKEFFEGEYAYSDEEFTGEDYR